MSAGLQVGQVIKARITERDSQSRPVRLGPGINPYLVVEVEAREARAHNDRWTERYYTLQRGNKTTFVVSESGIDKAIEPVPDVLFEVMKSITYTVAAIDTVPHGRHAHLSGDPWDV